MLPILPPQKLVEGGVVAVDELEENRVWDQANSAALSTGRREQFAAAQAPIEARASREAMKEHTHVLARIACGEAVHVHVLRKVVSPDPAEPRSEGAGRQRGDSLFQFLQSRSGLFSLDKILLVALFPGFAALLEFGRRVVRLSELLLKAEAGGLAGSSKLAHSGPQSLAALLALPQKLWRLSNNHIQRSRADRGRQAATNVVRR